MFCFSATILAQPANDDPCQAKLILPTKGFSNGFQDNSANSLTSLKTATATTGFGVLEFDCEYNPATGLKDVWFKIPLDRAILTIKTTPIAGFDVAFQTYYKQSGSCAVGDFMMSALACVNASAAGIADSLSVPYYYSVFIDTIYIKVYHHPDGTGPAPVNNSQFSIAAYYPEPNCTANIFPADGEEVMKVRSLQWNYNSQASQYDVYFGNTIASASFIARTESTNFDISSLDMPAGTYYWYALPMNGTVSATGCSSIATLFTILEPAANNLICNAKELFSSSTSCSPFIDNNSISTTSYYRATYEREFPSYDITCNSTSIDADVWFKFTAPDSAYYVFNVTPVAGINTSFRIYESLADCTGNLISRGCFNTGSTAIADTALLLLNPGKQYFIQVFSQNGSRDFNPPGNSQFGICIYKKVPDCIGSMLVSPANGATTVDHIAGSLSWKNVPGASRYDLYVGTTVENMQLVKYNSLQISGDNMVLNFKTNFSKSSPFFPGAEYFWKVIPVNLDLVNTNCTEEIGSFKTYDCPPSLRFVTAVIQANRAGELDYSVPCVNCPSSWLVFEYGPNRSAGTGLTPAIGNTIVYPVAETLPSGYLGRVSIDSPHLFPTYNYFIRANGCSNMSSTYLSFITPEPISLTTCSTATIHIENGKGRWDFEGKYPVNSIGKATPGKMEWFNFTPTESAVYYLQVDSLEITDPLNYLYKVDSLNKYSSENWTGIAVVNKKGKYPIGYLIAGLTYHFVADSENDSMMNRTTSPYRLTTHHIKICKADVLSPSITNACIEAQIYNPIPALSPKEEFAIDTSGRLIASIKPGKDSLGMVSVSYYVNGNGLRYDSKGTEYLDRNFTITPSNTPATAQFVKLFFTNDELGSLMIAPDDGNADVHSINDLVVTKTDQTCNTSANVGVLGNLFINPIDRGAYNSTSGFISVPVNGFSTLSIAILPLRFLSFTAKRNNENVVLNWKTENEQNISLFQVERSIDGINYSSLGNVKAANTAGVYQYRYTDNDILTLGPSFVYYRLKQLDVDGKFAYSKIVALSIENRNIVKLYPNPATKEVNLLVTVTKKEQAQLKIIDNYGRVVKQQDTNLSIGSTTLSMDISGLSKGMYYVEIKGETVNERKSFVKQ